MIIQSLHEMENLGFHSVHLQAWIYWSIILIYVRTIMTKNHFCPPAETEKIERINISSHFDNFWTFKIWKIFFHLFQIILELYHFYRAISLSLSTTYWCTRVRLSKRVLNSTKNAHNTHVDIIVVIADAFDAVVFVNNADKSDETVHSNNGKQHMKLLYLIAKDTML